MQHTLQQSCHWNHVGHIALGDTLNIKATTKVQNGNDCCLQMIRAFHINGTQLPVPNVVV